MKRRSRTRGLPLAVDVNVTSLVDVAFTLLAAIEAAGGRPSLGAEPPEEVR